MTSICRLIDQSAPPKPTWGVDDIPDLSGQIIIVTGGNTGVGKATVKALLQHNAKVYLAARSQQKAEEAIEDLKRETGKEAQFLKLDLANLRAVKAAVHEFLSLETQLHVLFNNGGVMNPPVEQLTSDGYDLQFGTNVLGHFYFTKLLLPILIATSNTSPDGKTRVINTSSSTHMFSGINFDTLRDEPVRLKTSTQTLYAQSKNGVVVFATELARRYGDQGIMSVSLNPGNLKSELQRHASDWQRKMMNSILYDVSYGALTQLWAGTSPEGASFNGLYLIPWARRGKARADAQDPEIGQQLWEWLEEQVKDV